MREQRDLAKNLTLLDQVEHRLATITGGDADAHHPSANHEKARPGVTLAEDRGTARTYSGRGTDAQPLDMLERELAE